VSTTSLRTRIGNRQGASPCVEPGDGVRVVRLLPRDDPWSEPSFCGKPRTGLCS